MCIFNIVSNSAIVAISEVLEFIIIILSSVCVTEFHCFAENVSVFQSSTIDIYNVNDTANLDEDSKVTEF